jgi:hypothetical protein
MWNEASVAARGGEGLAEGIVMDDVVHVGRSWFRMTSAVATSPGDDAVVVRSMPVSKTARLGEIVVVPPDDMTARSLFESAFEASAPGNELLVGKPRRTVTVSLWGLATLGAALLSTGAAVTMMLRPQPAAPISAPAVTTPAPVVTAPVPVQAPVIVEPLAAEPPSPPSYVVAAEPPVPAAPAVRPSLVHKAPVPVSELTPVRRVRPATPSKVGAAAAATAPDPFAPRAKTAWVDPFAD